MRPSTFVVVLVAASAWLAALPLPALQAEESAPSEPVTQEVPIQPDSTWSFELELGHRMYPEWKDSVTVGVGEPFYLGDTEFTAAVESFFPDFKIIDGKRMNTSLRMTNPAVHVIVYQGDAPSDSSWAFLNFPPHFSPDAFFTFRLMGITGYEEPAEEVQAAEGSTP